VLVRCLLAMVLLCVLPARGEGRIEMFYLGTADCPYQPIVARHYPPEFQWVYEQIGPSRGVPRFLLAVDGRITVSAYGTGGYSQVFLPALRAAVAQRAAAQPRAGLFQGETHARNDPS